MKIVVTIAAALLAAGITTRTTSQPDIIPAAQLPTEPQTYTVTGTFLLQFQRFKVFSENMQIMLDYR